MSVDCCLLVNNNTTSNAATPPAVAAHQLMTTTTTTRTISTTTTSMNDNNIHVAVNSIDELLYNDGGRSSTSSSSSAIFGKSLKKYTPIQLKNETHSNMITSFNFELFSMTCNKDSPSYDPEVCDYDAIAKELFQVNEVWVSKDLIESVIQLIAQHHGWSAIKKKNSIICNRVGDDTSTRNYDKGSLKANCTFIVKLSCLDSIPYVPEGSTKKSYKKPSNAPHKIIEAVCEHGGSCKPGRMNRVVTLQRGGKYMENLLIYPHISFFPVQFPIIRFLLFLYPHMKSDFKFLFKYHKK
jgi:hypothetical protein